MKGYAVLAGLALLAAASARSKRREQALNPLEREKALEGDTPLPRVGDADFEWPMKDRFPDPKDFQRAFWQLGYEVNVDGDVLSEESVGVVNAFQLDWNVAAQAFKLGDGVETTGYIDALTVPAIATALDQQKEHSNDWFNIVGEALDQLRPEVG